MKKSLIVLGVAAAIAVISSIGFVQGQENEQTQTKQVVSLVLIEGQNVNAENLGISLLNAKQIVFERAHGFGMIVHIHANSPVDLDNALRKFAQIPGVTGVMTLGLRTL